MYQADVVIVGAGVVGCAIARELSRYDLQVLVVDKRDDVGGDASKSNSSIAITGFDCPPGSLEARLCHETRARFDHVTKELDVPFRVCGALMPAITPEQMERLPAIYDEAMANDVTDVIYLTPEEILALAREEGYELSDEELSAVSGGGMDCSGFANWL